MRPRASPGFTYIGLMVLITVIGLVGAASLKLGTLFQRAAAEEELLEIGAQFSEALRSYAAATPQGKPQQPPSLQDLLKDPRFPGVRRHLRKIFVDPITGKAEWGIMYIGDKAGVIGVYSLSNRRPLKIANFDIRFQNMDKREHISDWKFLMAGGEGVNPALATPPNSMTGAGSSLFRPGPQAGQPGAGVPVDAKPGDPFAAAGKTGAAQPPGDKPSGPPLQQPPPDQAPPDEAKPEPPQPPMDTAPEENKDPAQQPETGEAKDPAPEAATETDGAASVPPPPPPDEGQRHQR